MTFDKAEDLLKFIHLNLLDEVTELSKEERKDKNLNDYFNALRKACIALGEYRYSSLKS